MLGTVVVTACFPLVLEYIKGPIESSGVATGVLLSFLA